MNSVTVLTYWPYGKASLFREVPMKKVMTNFVTAGVCFAVLLLAQGFLQGTASEEPMAVQGQKGSPVTEGGYSIFHETMADMTWEEVEQAAKEGAIILTNTAVIEEHGPHMGCGIDSYLGYLMCKLIRRDLEARGIKTLIAPPFYWGINRTSHVFPGTFTVSVDTMKAVLHDIFSSLKNMGFNTVFNINSHGDGLHIQTAVQAVRNAREELGLDAKYLLSDFDAKRSGLTDNVPPFLLIFKTKGMDEMMSQKYMDLHAGAWETSAVAAYFPDVLDEKEARDLEDSQTTAGQLQEWVRDMKKVTPLGYLGDPSKFDAESGRKDMEESCRLMADAIADYLKKK
jgi:creatinine amidohydrolase